VCFLFSQLEKDLKRECPYLIPAVDIVKAISFPPEFDNNQIFNDLSIQTFPLEKLSKVDESFWTTVYQVGNQEKHDKE
jgi:hypothetical protein